MSRRHSVDVLQECMDLQEAKAKDYQNEVSSVQQSDYYPSGFKTILEIMHAKLLRMRSIVETFEKNPTSIPKFESLEDSCKDLINYASFGVSYLRYRMDGQHSERDILNRPQTNAEYLNKPTITAQANVRMAQDVAKIEHPPYHYYHLHQAPIISPTVDVRSQEQPPYYEDDYDYPGLLKRNDHQNEHQLHRTPVDYL